jgi:hypothetical protein
MLRRVQSGHVLRSNSHTSVASGILAGERLQPYERLVRFRRERYVRITKNREEEMSYGTFWTTGGKPAITGRRAAGGIAIR